MPLVSVGVPTFNRSKSLRRCVASVRTQRVQDIEIIIADNGSTDDTWRVCEELAAGDPRVRVFRHSVLLNSTQNFDFVRKQAKGTYVLLLGDDDWIDDDYLDACTAALEARPDHIAVGGRPVYYRDGKRAFEGIVLRAGAEDPAERLLQALSLVVDAGTFHAVFRRSMSAPIPIVNAYGMDYLFICEAAYCGKIDTLSDTTVHRIDNSHLKPIPGSVRDLGLPPAQGRDHYATIAALIFWYLAATGDRFAASAFWPRLSLAARAAAIVFRRWHVRDEARIPEVARSIFPDADLDACTRRIRCRLLDEALPALGDPASRLWNDDLPAMLPTLARLGFRQTSPTSAERQRLVQLHAALDDSVDAARRGCALLAVQLFY